MIKWKMDGIFNANAEKVDKEIKKIGETVTPTDLLSYAQNHEKSELHKCFEWDDTVAAEKYRLKQARNILQFIVEVPESDEKPVVREYSITTERNHYTTTRSFLVNQDEYGSLLDRAKGELKAFEQKYKTLSELESVFLAIDEL